ncbi:MAG: divalent-cation tolerance protein CutA [Gammaproteobacteria bacterium]|nr:divalent-cation tolerance protein CutA [Gammaproteobacteria bacterium]
MTEFIQVTCNCPDEDSARQIAQSLVELKLAACVNIIANVESIYSWQGQLEQAREVQLQIKTSKSLYQALEDKILQLHPYDVAEVIALPIISGNKAYLDWLKGNLH